jgi:hypothetical protein
MGKKCREVYFEKLVGIINSANSELQFTRDYESALRALHEITRDICKVRDSNSVTVRVKSLYHSRRMLVTLDVEKSQLNSQYLIVLKRVVLI